MRTISTACLTIALAIALTACGQLGPYGHGSGGTEARSFLSYHHSGEETQEPNDQRDSRPPRRSRERRYEPGRPYGQTRARLQLIREDIELRELDVDLDNAPDIDLRDVDRERIGFRAEFGSGATGGFFQLFTEDMRAPALLAEEFTNYGVGGGISGAPVVGHVDDFDFVVPHRLEINLARGSESVNGFDQDLYYAESQFELGFGARIFGLQGSSGVMVHSMAGWFDSDDPANISTPGDAGITGTNVGAYFELLYKHDRVPLMARARAIVGDFRGVMFSFGFAF